MFQYSLSIHVQEYIALTYWPENEVKSVSLAISCTH